MSLIPCFYRKIAALIEQWNRVWILWSVVGYFSFVNLYKIIELPDVKIDCFKLFDEERWCSA